MTELQLCAECRGKGRTFYYSMRYEPCKRCGGAGAHWFDKYPNRWDPNPPYYSGKLKEQK